MLHVAIAGAGITGLVAAFAFARCGHSVDVYERKTERVFANEGGAGFQLQPNVTRILDTWGIDISAISQRSVGIVMRRRDGQILGIVKPVAGYHMYVIRSDFRRAMLAEALKAGARVHFDQDIIDIDFSRPALLMAGGAHITADLIIGADGIRSKVRQVLFPSIHPRALPEVAHQVQIPLSAFKSAAVLELLQAPNANVVVGPGTGIVISEIPSRQILDVQFLQADYGWDKDMNPNKWIAYIPDMKNLRRRYQSYGGAIPEVLELGTGAWKWRFAELSAPSWASPNGRVILAGDAVHATVPYAGQGAGMCIEDAATLAELFQNVDPNDATEFERLATVYQELRKPRTDLFQQRARLIGMSWALPDGKMQQKRDAAFKNSMQRKSQLPSKGNRAAHPLSHEFDNWLEQFDTLIEVSALILFIGAQARGD
jgi:salicylate hydroxylase